MNILRRLQLTQRPRGLVRHGHVKQPSLVGGRKTHTLCFHAAIKANMTLELTDHCKKLPQEYIEKCKLFI